MNRIEKLPPQPGIDDEFIKITDLIHSSELPPFPGLDESPEITLLDAQEQMSEQQYLDLLRYYCEIHGLDFLVKEPTSMDQPLPIPLPTEEPTLL